MKMIAGLGNPGRDYEGTPHNVGFVAVDLICQSLGGDWRIEPRFKADVAKVSQDGESLLLVKPMTYMNDSGEAIGQIMRYYRMTPEEVIVISDDVNLLPGRIRVRATGSAGGHNGLKSTIEHLGSQQFTRVRIGVGLGKNESGTLVGHVLGRIAKEDAEGVADGTKTAAEAALFAAHDGTEAAMNHYNAASAPQPSGDEEPVDKRNTTHNDKTKQLNNKEHEHAQEI